MKQKTITVSFPHLDPDDATGTKPRYRVEKVVNDTSYNPHEFMNKREVQTLCESSAWTVNIVPAKSEA